MVFHFIDRLIGHDGDVKYYLKDKTQEQLVSLGFSEKEAENLGWLENHKNKGFYYGLIVGLGSLYFLNPYYKALEKGIPYLKNYKSVNIGLRLGTLGLCMWGGYWYTESKRFSGNYWISNLYSNNKYTKSKEAFLQNFEVLNRQFTTAEIDQFIENRVRERGTQERKWIYNPNIHGDSEEEFRKNIETYFKKNVHPSQKPESKQQLQIQNAEKLQQGETVKQLPYNLVKDIDMTGVKHHIQETPFGKHGAWTKIQ